MEIYCVGCKKKTLNENSSVRENKQDKVMLLWNCVVCGKKTEVH